MSEAPAVPLAAGEPRPATGELAPAAGPVADQSGVTFHFEDPAGAYVAVCVLQEVTHPRCGPDLEQVRPGWWRGRLARPPVDRLEYQFRLTRHDGSEELVCDPANPTRAPGAFGEKSAVEFPGYRRPNWVSRPVPNGDRVELALPAPSLGADQPALLWTAPGTVRDQPLPLLVALDGIEFDRFSGLTRFLDAMVAQRALPPLRALLVQPTWRDEHYSANPAFAAALRGELLPAARRQAAVPTGRLVPVGLGASLGALALLHAQRTCRGLFGGLFLQSGSFFDGRQSADYRALPHFERIRLFVESVLAEHAAPPAVPVAVTCGRVERNFANNRALVRALREQQYPVWFSARRDAHNWIAWRDAWAPGLVRLLRRAWS